MCCAGVVLCCRYTVIPCHRPSCNRFIARRRLSTTLTLTRNPTTLSPQRVSRQFPPAPSASLAEDAPGALPVDKFRQRNNFHESVLRIYSCPLNNHPSFWTRILHNSGGTGCGPMLYIGIQRWSPVRCSRLPHAFARLRADNRNGMYKRSRSPPSCPPAVPFHPLNTRHGLLAYHLASEL